MPVPRMPQVDVDRGIYATRRTQVISPPPSSKPEPIVPVTLEEKLAAYRVKADPFFRMQNAALFGLLGELIERVEQLEKI